MGGQLRHAAAGDHPLHWLAGDLGDEIEVAVVMEHRDPVALRAGSDQEVRYRGRTVLAASRECRLHLYCAVETAWSIASVGKTARRMLRCCSYSWWLRAEKSTSRSTTEQVATARASAKGNKTSRTCG